MDPQVVTAVQLQVRCSFEQGTLFEPRYQRNNKRGGLKNLRCFPSCGPSHKARGFCGRSVVVHVDACAPLSSQTGQRAGALAKQSALDLVVLAEFVPASNAPRFTSGEFVDTAHYGGLLRTAEEPLRALIPADGAHASASGGALRWQFELNRKKKGWHYGWTANKHSCNTLHCLRVYVLCKLPGLPDTLLCKGSLSSPTFVLYCRRRRRFSKATDEADAIALAKGKAAGPKAEGPKAGLKRAAPPDADDAESEEGEEEEEEEEDEDEGGELDDTPQLSRSSTPTTAGGKKLKTEWPPSDRKSVVSDAPTEASDAEGTTTATCSPQGCQAVKPELVPPPALEDLTVAAFLLGLAAHAAGHTRGSSDSCTGTAAGARGPVQKRSPLF
jgi:hypothetical protein